MKKVREKPTESGTPNPVTQEIIALTVGLIEKMHVHFARVTSEFDLSPMEGRALYLLDEPTPMSALAENLHCDPSYVTGITRRLEELSLVERQTSTIDKRIKNLVLTVRGEELRKAVMLRTEHGLPATNGLSLSQCLALRELLRVSTQSDSAEPDLEAEPNASSVRRTSVH